AALVETWVLPGLQMQKKPWNAADHTGTETSEYSGKETVRPNFNQGKDRLRKNPLKRYEKRSRFFGANQIRRRGILKNAPRNTRML
ncbi:hypothetical protein FQN55_001771, partial [Onygenales sp. PD_40]